uniref:Prostaglandin reductase 1 n=1 Tax=Timema shepardi TaxID=629360 RepID=A0A7R9FXY9_TIMSH|nr:unnamed protein product [Timema shepardi]
MIGITAAILVLKDSGCQKEHNHFELEVECLSIFSVCTINCLVETMVTSKKIVLAKKLNGEPKESDFKIIEEELPALKDGEILVEAVWLSVDPYQRIVESRNPDFPVGKLVCSTLGWRTKSVVDVNKPGDARLPKPYLLPDFQGLPASLGVGFLGMPGNTAYFGFLEICKPKPGEVVVVTGAAGAVGSIVGQIAKIKGCKVIGFAGTDDKVKWLLEELGFDAAYNYKTKDIVEALEEAAPEGVDCYFDNVGGSLSIAVTKKMKLFGRISVCGSISSYNSGSPPGGSVYESSTLQQYILANQLTIQRFRVGQWNDQWFDGLKQLVQWTKEGKLKYYETVTEGFENTVKAFIGMLRGENMGKAVVKV